MKMMWLMALREPESLKSPVTEVALLIVNWHAPVPEHGPDQPKKLEVAAGVAVSVTAVPGLKFAVQVCGQLMPAGVLVIVPLPGPVMVNDKEPGAENAAETLVSAFKTTEHFPVPEQAPDQPAKEPFVAGVALRLTEVPASNVAVQVVPQLIPAGVLVIVPEPVEETVRLNCAGGGGAVCSLPPPQPLNVPATKLAMLNPYNHFVARTS
jgi:hypothetical protein